MCCSQEAHRTATARVDEQGVGPALLRTVWFSSAWGLENFSEGAPHGLHSEGDNESYHITPGEVLGLLQTERTETTAFSAWSLTRPTARRCPGWGLA